MLQAGLYRERADIQLRMKQTGRTGWYLRVIEPGEVIVGSPIEVVDRDLAGLSVKDAHLGMADLHLENRDLAQRLADHSALADEWRDPLRERFGQA